MRQWPARGSECVGKAGGRGWEGSLGGCLSNPPVFSGLCGGVIQISLIFTALFWGFFKRSLPQKPSGMGLPLEELWQEETQATDPT